MPLVDLLGRSLALVMVPTKDYFFFIVLTPAIGAFFTKTSTLVLAPTTTLDRGKEVTI